MYIKYLYVQICEKTHKLLKGILILSSETKLSATNLLKASQLQYF